MKTNYKKWMDAEIAKIKEAGSRPTLLLHACCAPCASAVVELLHPVFDITLFFYNPNIAPEEEHTFRLEELRRLCREMGLSDISVVVPPYTPAAFFDMARGRETLSEGGARCRDCYEMRLSGAAAFAAEKGFDYFTTTLSISPYKNANWLCEIGLALGKRYGVKYLFSDFKKGEGYKRSCQLSAVYNLYRQNYCGCIYSKQAAEDRQRGTEEPKTPGK